MTERRRLVLYALTDGRAHNHLLVGTIAAHLERENFGPDLLRRSLRALDPHCCDQRGPAVLVQVGDGLGVAAAEVRMGQG